MAIHSKAPTPASVERSILAYLKKRSAPVTPSFLFQIGEGLERSTASERRRALWNLVDTGKIIVRDRKVRLVDVKK
jgi:hypothetical protein